jgi:hypothetical protein
LVRVVVVKEFQLTGLSRLNYFRGYRLANRVGNTRLGAAVHPNLVGNDADGDIDPLVEQTCPPQSLEIVFDNFECALVWLWVSGGSKQAIFVNRV